MNYIYIYIYIYILSSTDRLFRCITTHQCGLTRETLQAEFDTRLPLPQADAHTLKSNLWLNGINVYRLTFGLFFFFHFALSDTEAQNSLEDLCITRVVAVNSFMFIHRHAVSLTHKWERRGMCRCVCARMCVFLCVCAWVCERACVYSYVCKLLLTQVRQILITKVQKHSRANIFLIINSICIYNMNKYIQKIYSL